MELEVFHQCFCSLGILVSSGSQHAVGRLIHIYQVIRLVVQVIPEVVVRGVYEFQLGSPIS